MKPQKIVFNVLIDYAIIRVSPLVKAGIQTPSRLKDDSFMANLNVITVNDNLVVDSRLIADELDIQHESFIRTIRKYLTEIQEFGHIRFENTTVVNSVGARNTAVFCYLNEDQATYVMTLSRNTNKVRECKRNLVKAFSEAKKVIQTVIPQQSERIRELELQLAIATQNNQSNQAALQVRQLDHTMLTMHGAPTVLALRGMADQVVEIDKPTLDVIDNRHNVRFKGQTLPQIKDYIAQKYGIKFKYGADIRRKLEKAGRGDLIAQTPRTVLADYIPEENLDEAYRILQSGSRQLLIGFPQE